MTRDQLFFLLASIAAAGAPLATASCAACPATEVDSSTDRSIGADVACDLMTKQALGFESGIPASDCAAACDDRDVTRCFVDAAYSSAFNAANPTFAGGTGQLATCPSAPTSATVTCQVLDDTISWSFGGCPIEGRRPASLEAPDVLGSSVGAYLARCAHLEAASVVAFQVLAADLIDLGAPYDALVADARSAEADEIRHAAAMTRLARAYGAEPPAVKAPPRAPRSAIAIAIENVVEGVVREAFGAAVAIYQAEHASDPAVRSALRVIARDECAHAALAIQTAELLEGRLSDAERALVDAAKRAAIEELIASVEEPPAAIGAPLGLPSASSARRMLAAMQRDLWSSSLAA